MRVSARPAVLVATVVAVALVIFPDVASAATTPSPKVVTIRVTGGLTSAPALVPTSFDLRRLEGTGLCPEQWYGSWSGESTCTATSARFDRKTGNLTARLIDGFEGVSMPDHQHGTLTIDERVAGNLFEGTGILDGVIVDGTGAFACSSGHVTLDMFLTAAGAYGGYDGTWTRGSCPDAHAAPVWPPLPQIAGGILSTPAALPTGGDPSTFSFKGIAPLEWTGVLMGESIAKIPSAHVDPATGDLTGHVIETLAATDMRDHSTGTLVIDEVFTGNLIVGNGFIDGTITAASGDRTFRCMRGGHFSQPFFLNYALTFGGYVLDRPGRCPR